MAQLYGRHGRDSRFSRPGWLFTSAMDRSDSVGHQRPAGGRSPTEGTIYRIWTTHRDSRPSVLIEESRWPLTAPSWSPRGKSIAFGRFVPISIETTQAVQRGRLEIVIQDGRDHKRVVWSVPDLELDPVARADLSNLSCCWSPDGLYLAVPRLAPAGNRYCGTDTMKCLHKLDSATQPAWSPDGTKCALFGLTVNVMSSRTSSAADRASAISSRATDDTDTGAPILVERQSLNRRGRYTVGGTIAGARYRALRPRAWRFDPRHEFDPRTDAPDCETARSVA